MLLLWVGLLTWIQKGAVPCHAPNHPARRVILPILRTSRQRPGETKEAFLGASGWHASESALCCYPGYNQAHSKCL